jgi:hypothetical protein
MITTGRRSRQDCCQRGKKNRKLIKDTLAKYQLQYPKVGIKGPLHPPAGGEL